MLPENHILRYLESGPATAGALADSLRLLPEAVAVILRRLAAERRVLSRPLGGMENVPVYHLP